MYTENEVRELLKQQRKLCADSLCCMPSVIMKAQSNNVLNAPPPSLPLRPAK